MVLIDLSSIEYLKIIATQYYYVPYKYSTHMVAFFFTLLQVEYAQYKQPFTC